MLKNNNKLPLAKLYRNDRNYFISDLIIVENSVKLDSNDFNSILKLNFIKFGKLILAKNYFCQKNYLDCIKYY